MRISKTKTNVLRHFVGCCILSYAFLVFMFGSKVTVDNSVAATKLDYCTASVHIIIPLFHVSVNIV